MAFCWPRAARAPPAPTGTVEQGGVHDGKRKVRGGRGPTLMTQANVDVRPWCRTTAGQRVHGTTKEPPLEHFEAVARAQLKPLPPMADDLAVWTRLTRHRACDGVCEQAFDAAPFRLMGQPLWGRDGSQAVRP